MKQFLLLLLLMVLCRCARSQTLSFDSIWKEAASTQNDTARFRKITTAFLAVSLLDLVLAERLIDSLEAELQKHPSADGQLRLVACKANLLMKKEDFVSSIRLYDSIAKIIKSKKGYDKERLARIMNSIALDYFRIKDYEKAQKAWDEAFLLYTEAGNENQAATVIGNIGHMYAERGDFETARKNCQFNIVSDLKFNNRYSLGNDYTSMAEYMIGLNMPDSAIYYCNLALGLEREADYSTHARILGAYGNAYFMKKDYTQSEMSFDKALNVASKRGNYLVMVDLYKSQSKLYEATGEHQKALNAYKNYTIWKDSTHIIDKRNQVALNEIFKEKEQYESDLKQQKFIRNGAFGGFVLVLVFAGVFFAQRNKISKGKKRSDELLLNILPEEVAEELKQKGSADAKQFDDVTVMFTDFKNFTQISEKLSPTELVAEIHTCFKAFDCIIEKHNIEKIKTIGDSYMCVGGLPVANTTNPTDVVNAAMEIQNFLHGHNLKRKNEGKEVFEIRIGIHSGPVVAGIVGVKKYAYDIWGDTVNIASRMESSGEAGKLNISGSTYELVKEHFACTHRGKIQAKNKGEIDMYFVDRSFSQG